MRSAVQARVSAWIGRRGVAALAVLAVVLVGVPLSAGTALAAAVDQRVNLRVLVVSNGDPSVEAIATQLDREGVPFTKVVTGTAGRPVLDAAFLADAATHTGRFQAVVVPNHDGQGLTAAEVAALASYERSYGVRQVSAYNWPSAPIGLGAPSFAGNLDGGTVTVTPAGLSGPFGYLDGSLPVDDFDPATGEVYAYLAQPLSPLPAGETFTPLLTAAVGGHSGVLAGVHSASGQEELVLTAAFNPSMQWWNDVAHGVVTWMTRGIHLGHQRNYFAVQVDDVFLPDGRWSVAGNCTPGDDCVDTTVSTKDIRMTAADVTRLVAWQRAADFKLDMVYNGGGSAVWKEDAGLAATSRDPLLDAFLAAQSEFPWVNHTYTHPFLGCIQVAPTVIGGSWHCATSPTEGPRQDPAITGTMASGTYWASPEFLLGQVQLNQAWGKARFTDFDPAELVTGEHSGLATQPQQPSDNPFLGPVLAQAGIAYTASDASREPNARAAGTATVTVPRHPMNIYYNAGTFLDQIDEYNWYYTSRTNGGSGICEDNPSSTCITPLAAGTSSQARTSFDGYLKPLEVRNALLRVLTNDPRPFYAHQSNLAEDGILYPVVQGVLDQYRAVHAANAPLVRSDLRSQSQVLAQMATWRAAAEGVPAYLDSTGVHVTGGDVQVPVTVPAGTKVSGASLSSYGGELSGWTTGTVTAVPGIPRGGYVGVPATTAPAAPTIGTATAGNASASVSWTAPATDGGSPVTGYVVSVYEGDSGTVARTVSAGAGATTAELSGLTNGTPYTFTVAAVNSAGTSPASSRSASVTPAAPATVPGAPTIGSATAGNSTASVSWTAPATDGGSAISGYRLSLYEGTGASATRTVDVAAPATSADLAGLVNGSSYSFSVAAMNSVGLGPDSARSSLVTPVTVPGAPTVTSVTSGDASVSVAWTAPAENGGSAVTGYVVSVSAGAKVVATVDAAAAATSADVAGLVNGTEYTVSVAAVNAAGTGTASAAVLGTPRAPVTVPGAPTVTSVTAGDASVSVAWTAPADNGGSAVTGYVVSVYEGTGATVTSTVAAPAAATSVTVPGLRNGTSYSFTVSAENAAGRGAASQRSAAVTPSTVPGVPVVGRVTAANASASVPWAMSTETGGSPLTGYVVRAYPGAATAASVTVQVPASSTQATLAGLTNGTAYTFTVAAMNAVGSGAESARSASVVPTAPPATPGAPVIGTATPGDRTATVNWTAPVQTGTSPVTGYRVAVYAGTSSRPVRTVDAGRTATGVTVTGLTNGLPYTFTVAAVNTSGAGVSSARSNPVTPAALPAAPRMGNATAGDGSASLNWSAPSQKGGSPVTGYLVTVFSGVRQVKTVASPGPATRTTVTGLTNGVAYTFTVSAVTVAGTGAASQRSNAVTPRGVAGAPTSVKATAGDKKATVSWRRPADNGGSPITGYVVSVYAGTGTGPTRTVTAGGTATSVTVPGLSNGAAYTFTVAAVTAAGTGTASDRSNSVTVRR